MLGHESIVQSLHDFVQVDVFVFPAAQELRVQLQHLRDRPNLVGLPSIPGHLAQVQQSLQLCLQAVGHLVSGFWHITIKNILFYLSLKQPITLNLFSFLPLPQLRKGLLDQCQLLLVNFLGFRQFNTLLAAHFLQLHLFEDRFNRLRLLLLIKLIPNSALLVLLVSSDRLLSVFLSFLGFSVVQLFHQVTIVPVEAVLLATG